MSQYKTLNTSTISGDKKTKKDYITEIREMVLAKQVAQFIPELRLIDVGDFISCIHTERFHHLSELIESAAELRFYPNTMLFAQNASYELDWDTTPNILLHMKFSNDGVQAFFQLTMSAEQFGVEIDHCIFDNPADEETNTSTFMNALNNARIQKQRPLAH
ncbi:hypothetical protein X471_01168 [Bartonella bacilliformis str. Heidi Mejia]|uniref:Uncharacterized protein n=2 Tax=Bartonella bacilliformis TaxID=774 RepID=A1UTW0_BARBK|nr:hypothetical protein [Bartonella bacilliformis]ABM45069.1 conserved hypothetical protein [Bartonella bacilliformis KC583]AMG86157.1 hypothetical protein AL467_05460 [Bartonella bacilliformis]EKS43051.1 hypothetical protein BbINS_05432 [Bartonella bacilliformis INS]EYS88609.1 hypothetical protein X472_01160 [Bartonella bacilliformis San Pedro600-02]EYS91033.1 hypothetical protein X471_01168 [Bartonella bacilliformis str. Heidi Mejia]